MKIHTHSSRLPVQVPFFYGWVIVAVSALGVFFSGPGQTYSVSIFIDSFILDFGWSRSFVSSLYSAGTLTAGFLLLSVGRQIDRRGHRFMFPAIAGVFGLACLWMSVVVNPFMLFIGFLLVRLLGQGSMTLVSSTLAPQWFFAQRGRALSLVSIGGVVGSAVIPPLNTWLIDGLGWRMTWQVWAALLCLIMAPLARLLVRNQPEDIQLLPDNGRSNRPAERSAAVKSGGSRSVLTEERSWTLRQARKTAAFWLLLFCMFVPSMVNTGITFHLVSILGEQGISPTGTALVLSVIAATAMPTTLIAGWLMDRYPVRYFLALAALGQLLTMVYLLTVGSTSMAVAFGIGRGLVAGVEQMGFNVMWPDYFGRKHLGSLRGFSMMVTVLGSAFGPLPFGFAFDHFGGYREIVLLMMLFPAASVICAFLAKRPVISYTTRRG